MFTKTTATMNTVTIEKVLVEIPFGKTTINNLSDSGRLKRVKVGKEYRYDIKTIEKFKKEFNRDDYLTIEEVTEELKTNGIWDYYKQYDSYVDGNGKKKKKCKYQRFTKEFPISVKQLTDRGYLKMDNDFIPKLYSKESVVNTIKQLKGVDIDTPSNNINYSKRSKSKKIS